MKKIMFLSILIFCVVLCACGDGKADNLNSVNYTTGNNANESQDNLTVVSGNELNISQKNDESANVESSVDTNTELQQGASVEKSESIESKIIENLEPATSEITNDTQRMDESDGDRKTEITLDVQLVESENVNLEYVESDSTAITTPDEQNATDNSDYGVGKEICGDEWCKEKENTRRCNCSCQCSAKRIDMADAILIAQNHFFAMMQPEFSLDLVYSASYFCDDEETWTIIIGLVDVNHNDGEHSVVMGGGYAYVISKESGKILEIKSGE